MQIIKDLSIFTKQKARRLKANSKSMIYDAGGETVTQISLSDHPLLLNQPLHCRYVSRSILNKYFFQSRHRQKFLSLEYVLEGEMHVLCGNTGYILEAGDLALLHPGQKNCLLYLPGRVCRKYGVILNGRIMEETLRLLHLDQVNCIHLPDSKRLVEILARLKRELRRPVSLKTCECVSGITFELLNWVANANAPCHRIRESCEIQACLDQRINEKISIRQIAAEFKMSLPTFNLRFQKAFRMTPCQYLRKQRMIRAGQLLADTSLSIKEITEQTGFQNQLYFSAAFRQCYGLSPSEYRKRNS